MTLTTPFDIRNILIIRLVYHYRSYFTQFRIVIETFVLHRNFVFFYAKEFICLGSLFTFFVFVASCRYMYDWFWNRLCLHTLGRPIPDPTTLRVSHAHTLAALPRFSHLKSFSLNNLMLQLKPGTDLLPLALSSLLT